MNRLPFFGRSRRQATLVERHWETLRRRAPETPEALDADLADLSVVLARDADLLRPPADAQERVWQRVAAAAEPTQELRDWSPPAGNSHRQPPGLARPQIPVMPGETPPERPIDLAPRRRWPREVLKLAAAALIFGLIGALLALALRDNQQLAPATAPAVTVPAGPSPTPTLVPSSGASAFPAGTRPGGIAVGAGALWVPTAEGDLLRIDPVTGEVVAEIPIMESSGGSPLLFLVATSGDEVWVVRNDLTQSSDPAKALLRIDPATNAIVQTIPLDVSFNALAASDDAVWVASDSQSVVLRIDPVAGEIVARIPMTNPGQIAVANDSVWVANANESLVQRIDPATNQIVATIQLDNPVSDIVAGDTGVWIALPAADVIARIDPATNTIGETIAVGSPSEVAQAGGHVWALGFADGQFVVNEIDPQAGRVVARYASGVAPSVAASYRLMAVVESTPWVADPQGGRIVRISQ